MGARQSRRSVDITTTPKKEGAPAEGGVVGDAAAPGDGKLERIEEADSKPTSNGVAPHTDAAEDKEKDKDEANEKDKEKQQQEEVKSEEAKPESGAESPAEGAEVTTPTEASAVSPNTATSPESKETKKKDKVKKRWSFRSISFTKKDKSKPAREDAPKNGDVTKEEPLAEGCEEAENATASSPTEEKSAASSPTEGESATAAPAVTETKEEKTASLAEEKKEEVAAPVPVEDKKEEPAAAEKVEADKKAAVEVSPREVAADPREVSVSEVQQVAAPSIIERKTSEDLPPPLPSSPPPTPIDPSPLQQAQQAAASATALAEALKLPAEAENDDPLLPIQQSSSPLPTSSTPSSSCDRPQKPENPTAPIDVPNITAKPIAPIDEPTVQSTFVSAKESLPVVDRDTEEMEKASETLPEPDVIPQKPFIPEKNVELEGNAMPSEPAAEVKSQGTAEEGAKEETKTPQEVIVEEEIVEELPDAPPAQDEPMEEFKETVIEPTSEAKDEIIEEVVLDEDNEIVIEPSDMVVDSEEGPVPVSDSEVVVEAKLAVVIPDEIVEEIQDVEVDDSKGQNTDSVEVILDTDEEKIELESDTAMPTEEIPVSDIEPEETDIEPPSELPSETPDCPIIEETIVIVETPSKTEIIEIEEVSNMPPPPPMESSEKSVNESEPEQPVETDQLLSQETKPEEADMMPNCPLPEKPKSTMPTESPVLPESQNTDNDSCSIENKPTEECVKEIRSDVSSCPAEDLPDPSDDLPPAPVETLNADSFEYPLPPEELSCPYVPSTASVIESELPDPVEGDSSSRNPTETLLTPPTSPSPQSNVSIASNVTSTTTTATATRESSQLRLHEDDSNREFKMESVSLSLNSYDDSQVDSKERLAESLAAAETGDQEETALSCRLSNGTASPIAVQENHQSTPAEAEAPVENNVAAHETSMTESADEAPKVAPPTVPIEAPVAPPAAPTITEDVASVTKAIEEIDISDKAVAAAVNEAIECNTNEIVADAPYQNNVNE